MCIDDTSILCAHAVGIKSTYHLTSNLFPHYLFMAHGVYGDDIEQLVHLPTSCLNLNDVTRHPINR